MTLRRANSLFEHPRQTVVREFSLDILSEIPCEQLAEYRFAGPPNSKMGLECMEKGFPGIIERVFSAYYLKGNKNELR